VVDQLLHGENRRMNKVHQIVIITELPIIVIVGDCLAVPHHSAIEVAAIKGLVMIDMPVISEYHC